MGVSYCANGTYLWCVSPIKVGLSSFFGGSQTEKPEVLPLNLDRYRNLREVVQEMIDDSTIVLVCETCNLKTSAN